MVYKNKIYSLIKISISFCLILWIIKKVDYQEIMKIISSVKIHFFLLGFLWLILDRILMSYRWDILLMAKQVDIPFYHIVKIYFLGTFSGNFLPSSIAPDVVKVYFASKYNAKTSEILSSVIVDRVLGLFSLSVIALFSIGFIFFDSGEINRKSLIVIIAILFVISLLIYSDTILKKIRFVKTSHVLQVFKDNIIWKSLEKIYNSCNEYKKNYGAMKSALLVSFINHALGILAIYVLSYSVGIQVSLLYYFVFVPLINVLIMLPVSVGGIGVQEGAFIYFFSQVGVTSDEALTVALLFRALTIAVSIPGGILYIIEDTPHKVLSSK